MSLPEPANSPAATTVERRTLLRAAAWTTPAIAVAAAAPAYAASRCVNSQFSVNWTSTAWSYNSSTRTGVISATPSTTPAAGVTMQAPVLTFTNTFSGTMSATNATEGSNQYGNMAVSPVNVGGTSNRGLTLLQRRGNNFAMAAPYDARQTLALSFDRDVRKLRITITDVDAALSGNTGQYRDIISASLTPTSTLLGSEVTAATGTNRWSSRQAPGNNTGHVVTSGNGNVTLIYEGAAVRNLSIEFWNSLTTGIAQRGQQGIFISNISFEASSCR